MLLILPGISLTSLILKPGMHTGLHIPVFVSMCVCVSVLEVFNNWWHDMV